MTNVKRLGAAGTMTRGNRTPRLSEKAGSKKLITSPKEVHAFGMALRTPGVPFTVKVHDAVASREVARNGQLMRTVTMTNRAHVHVTR